MMTTGVNKICAVTGLCQISVCNTAVTDKAMWVREVLLKLCTSYDVRTRYSSEVILFSAFCGSCCLLINGSYLLGKDCTVG